MTISYSLLLNETSKCVANYILLASKDDSFRCGSHHLDSATGAVDLFQRLAALTGAEYSAISRDVDALHYMITPLPSEE